MKRAQERITRRKPIARTLSEALAEPDVKQRREREVRGGGRPAGAGRTYKGERDDGFEASGHLGE